MRVLIIALILALFSGACSSPGPKTQGGEAAEELSIPEENLKTVHLDVKGMTCEGCEKAIVTNIRKLEGIREASASHTAGEAVVQFDSTKASMEAIMQAITGAGYSVEGEKTEPMQ